VLVVGIRLVGPLEGLQRAEVSRGGARGQWWTEERGEGDMAPLERPWPSRGSSRARATDGHVTSGPSETDPTQPDWVGSSVTQVFCVSDLQTHKVSLSCIKNLKGKAKGLRARVLVSQTSESELEKKRLRDNALDDSQRRWATQTTTQRGEDKGDCYCRVRDNLETRELTTRQVTIYTVS
jgi:hypothetical protein